MGTSRSVNTGHFCTTLTSRFCTVLTFTTPLPAQGSCAGTSSTGLVDFSAYAPSGRCLSPDASARYAPVLNLQSPVEWRTAQCHISAAKLCLQSFGNSLAPFLHPINADFLQLTPARRIPCRSPVPLSANPCAAHLRPSGHDQRWTEGRWDDPVRRKALGLIRRTRG